MRMEMRGFPRAIETSIEKMERPPYPGVSDVWSTTKCVTAAVSIMD
jgi:hypothetical protein